ncbi:hypothetical protein ACRAWD_01950 [Caulobacter segnis]
MEVDLLAGFGRVPGQPAQAAPAERMQADAAEVARSLDLPVQPAQMSLLMTISPPRPDHRGRTGRAPRSRPSRHGHRPGALEPFVEARRAPRRAGARSLVPTPAGEALLVRVQTELLPRIEPAAAELVEGLSGDFMQGLAKVEARLAERSLLARIQAAGTPALVGARLLRRPGRGLPPDQCRMDQRDVRPGAERTSTRSSRPRELIPRQAGGWCCSPRRRSWAWSGPAP